MTIQHDRKHAHYYKDVSALTTIDIYRVLKLWDVTDPCLQHAIKKLLVAGGRGGGKDISRDVEEAIDALTRWQEMYTEEGLQRPKPCQSKFHYNNEWYQCTRTAGHEGRHECWSASGSYCLANWPSESPTPER